MRVNWFRPVAVLAAWLAVSGCAGGGVPAAGALPGDQIVFMVRSTGGMLASVHYLMQAPSLVIYGDGRVLTAVTPTVAQLVPARYQLARADAETVRGFVASALSGGLIGDTTDFGTPRVTDLDTTTVTVRGEQGQAEVRVYALADRFDTGLSPAQRDARARLRALIDQAAALPAGAGVVPYVPDRVAVYEPDSSGGDDPAVTRWPGPPLPDFLAPTSARRAVACGELTGTDAGTVYLAALDNPGARWLVDGATRVLAVNPLPLPDACP